MLDVLEFILVSYAKAGIAVWILVIISLMIRFARIVMKNDLIEIQSIIEDENAELEKEQNLPWWRLIIKFTIWPYGIIKFAKDYEKYEFKILQEIEKRHTC